MKQRPIALIVSTVLLAVIVAMPPGMGGQPSTAADARECAPLLLELERVQSKMEAEMGRLHEKLAEKMAAWSTPAPACSEKGRE